MSILILGSVTAYDYEERFNATNQNLPLSGISQVYTFPYVENATLYFNISQSDSRVVVNFPPNYNFSNTSANYDFKVNWTLLNTIYAIDETFNVSINITNSANSNYKTLGLIFNVTKIEPPLLVFNGSDDLKIINNTYWKIITADNLPDFGNLTFTFSGTPNEAFTITECKEIIQCPLGQFSFNSNGTIRIQIPYSIDYVAIGRMNTSFTLNTATKNTTVNIIFSIDIPDIFVTPPNLPEKCKLSPLPFADQLECEGLIQDYRKEIIVGWQRYISKVNTDKICANYKQIEYVIGDSISKLIAEENIRLLEELNYERRINDNLDQEITNLKEEVNQKELKINETIVTKDKEILNIQGEEQQKRIDIYRASEVDKADYRAEYGKITKILVFIFAIFPLLLLLFKYFMMVTYIRHVNLPTGVLIALSSIFTISWIALMLYM